MISWETATQSTDDGLPPWGFYCPVSVTSSARCTVGMRKPAATKPEATSIALQHWQGLRMVGLWYNVNPIEMSEIDKKTHSELKVHIWDKPRLHRLQIPD